MILAKTQNAKKIWFGLRCMFTLAILALLWQAAGGTEILDSLAQITPIWFVAAILMLIFQTFLSALRWQVTAAQLGQDLKLKYAIQEYFLSMAVNQILPGAVMGDTARAVRARGHGGLILSGQAVIFERLAGQLFMFLTLALAFMLTYWTPGGLDWPNAIAHTLLLIVCAGLGLLVLLIAISALPNFEIGRLRQWFKPLKIALFTPRIFPAQLLLGALITAVNLTAFGFAAEAVGVTLGIIEITALVPVILFAMLVPLTVSGWGVREGAAILVLSIVGIAAADAVAASIVFGLALLCAATPGAFMVVFKS